MDRPTPPPEGRKSSLAAALDTFFVGENRMTRRQRLLAILLFASLFAVIGDLLDVAARLIALLGG